jgi:shikimate kinase
MREIQRNIVLIGYRGTGKSTIGRILADRLGLPMVSTDEEIVRLAGATIPEIVERHGWDHFRDLESSVIERVTARGVQVLDCGGGAVLRVANRERLRENGVVVWLRASVKEIADRIRTDDQRPSLTGARSFVDEIEQVLKEREPIYQESCHFLMDTDGRHPDEIASTILKELRQQKVW